MKWLQGNVLITGGSGFLGRGIMRRAKREGWPCSFTVYSRDELKQDQCRRKFPDARYILGDITNTERLASAMAGHETIIHAAALKYIPEGEFNASECVSVNVDGARSVIRAARTAGVKNVVGISTDKAVHPVNIYGMTKAVMERLFAETTQWTLQWKLGPKFTTCRYGNVVGSTGSVIPVFKRLYEQEGLVYITHKDMTRFWISVDDAVDIILAALNPLCSPGSTVVPKPQSMKMWDLALVIAQGREHAIQTMGIRPGEKLHEDLISPQETRRTFKLLVNEGEWYEIRPVGSEGSDLCLQLNSGNPEAWVSLDRMRAMIEDSASV